MQRCGALSSLISMASCTKLGTAQKFTEFYNFSVSFMHLLMRNIVALQDAVNQQQAEAILAPAHLMAILLTEDKQRGSATAFVRNVHDEGTSTSCCAEVSPCMIHSAQSQIMHTYIARKTIRQSLLNMPAQAVLLA